MNCFPTKSIESRAKPLGFDIGSDIETLDRLRYLSADPVRLAPQSSEKGSKETRTESLELEPKNFEVLKNSGWVNSGWVLRLAAKMNGYHFLLHWEQPLGCQIAKPNRALIQQG